MDCAGIQERLSEYIDGALDDKTARMVEKHLSTCQDCKETATSLRAVVKELNALEPMPAPVDFLEKIHRRMAPRPQKNRLFRILFIPFKVKIPLQLAAAVAVSLLVVLVFNFQKQSVQMIQPNFAYQSQKAAEKPKTDQIRPLYKKELKNPAPVFKKTPPKITDSEQRLPAQRFVMKSFGQPQTQKEPEPASALPAGTGTSAKTGRPIKLALVLHTDTLGTALQPNLAIKTAPMREMAKKSSEEERIDKDLYARSMETRQKSQNETFLSRLNHILAPLKGDILSVNTSRSSGRFKSVLVEIPSENYESFCKDIIRFASFKTPPPALSAKSPETLKLLINVAYPE